MLAVDQDRAAGAAVVLPRRPDVLVKPLADGSIAVALCKATAADRVVAVSSADLGLPAGHGYTVTDLWDGSRDRAGGTALTRTVGAHDTEMLLLTPSRAN